MTPPPALVSDPAGVDALVAAVRAAGTCALDTEFLWEKTYAPQLCLAQIAVGDEIWLVDPLAGAPLEPIADLVRDPAVEKLMHAPSADLIAFGLHFGAVPANVFDTQIAAGFVGLTAGAGLDRLLDQVLKVRLSHDETFSDWSRRPLTDTQCLYAADDVRHLAALVAELRRRLAERGRGDWAQAEIERRFCSPEAAGADPERSWRKVQRRGRLSPTAQAVLVDVAAWRERTARRRDQPTAWVMKDPTLVEIARAAPRTADDLRRIRGVGKGFAGREADDLLAAVEAGLGRTPPPADPSPLDATDGCGDGGVGGSDGVPATSRGGGTTTTRARSAATRTATAARAAAAARPQSSTRMRPAARRATSACARPRLSVWSKSRRRTTTSCPPTCRTCSP